MICVNIDIKPKKSRYNTPPVSFMDEFKEWCLAYGVKIKGNAAAGSRVCFTEETGLVVLLMQGASIELPSYKIQILPRRR